MSGLEEISNESLELKEEKELDEEDGEHSEEMYYVDDPFRYNMYR